MDIVKNLEEVCKEICKELPEEKYHTGFLCTYCFQGGTPTLPSGDMPIGIGIYTIKGFLFNKKIDELYATIRLRAVKEGLMGRRIEGELGNKEYLKEHGLNIYSSDKKILNLFKEKINQSELRKYLNKKNISLKLCLNSN